MDISDNILNYIAEESNISPDIVRRYYSYLNKIPCVDKKDRHNFLNCLYLLIQNRKNGETQEFHIPFEYSLSDALYKVYKDEAIDYLYPTYMIYNNIEKPKQLIRH